DQTFDAIEQIAVAVCHEAAYRALIERRCRRQAGTNGWIVGDDVVDVARTLIADQFVGIGLDTERRREHIAVTEHADAAAACDLPARIDLRQIVALGLRRYAHF